MAKSKSNNKRQCHGQVCSGVTATGKIINFRHNNQAVMTTREQAMKIAVAIVLATLCGSGGGIGSMWKHSR